MHPRKPHVVVPLNEYTSLDQTVDLVSDLMSGRIIAFQRQFVDLAGSAAGALFLSQAMYWTKKGEGGWFYKSRDEWTEETGLTRYEQEAARKALKSLGILEEIRKGCPYQLHFRINKKQIYLVLSRLSGKIHSAENPLHSAENNPMDGGNPSNHSAENNQPYKEAEITTETTQKNTHTTPPLFELKTPEPRKTLREQKKENVHVPEWMPLPEWEAWLEVRDKKKCPNTNFALNRAIDKLNTIRISGGVVKEVLNRSILNGWKDVFEIKPEYYGNGHKTPDPPLEDALARERRKDAERRAR